MGQTYTKVSFMKNSRISLLQQMPIFGGVKESIIKMVLAGSEIVKVKKSTFFFNEGDPSTYMYVLETGLVAVIKTVKNRQYILAKLHGGDCFGEMEILDLQPRSASIYAQEDCSVIQIHCSMLYKIYRKDCQQYSLIIMNIARELSRRLREADNKICEAHIATGKIKNLELFSPK